MKRRPAWLRARFWIAVAVTVYVVALCIICVRVFSQLDGGCPGTAVDQQRDGLVVVKSGLPPGTVREELLNECDSGDGPFFTIYASGQSDPVQELMSGSDAWSPGVRDSSDPERRGSDASRPLEGATLSISSRPYTSEAQREQPEPGVNWVLSITVR